jgi:hypothetical protein
MFSSYMEGGVEGIRKMEEMKTTEGMRRRNSTVSEITLAGHKGSQGTAERSPRHKKLP